MKQLTYADRELLLQTFDSLKEGWEGADDELLVRACEWAKSIAPTFGFERALTRDIAVLSRYLVDRKDDQDIADIARGGLLYVLNVGEHGPAKLQDLGLLDDAFVSSYAVHEIRNRLGDPASYNPPRLTKVEQERAENLFLELVQESALGDVQLIEEARRVDQSLRNLAASGLFRRLRKNIDYLAAVLVDGNHTAEQQSYARAALAYIVCEQDAIDDRLGIIGYLDDNFITQLAVDLIEPNREPWLELLDATVGAWPFLNNFFVDDGSGVRLPSEFMIVNSALSCADLRAESDAHSAVLILPSTGPVPFLLGVVATIGLIQSTGRRAFSESDFHDGQKVLVDHLAIAEFAGFGDCNGRRMFKLRQYRTERGNRLESVRYWPISDLGRLTPADASRVTRGSLVHNLLHTDIPLPGLEYLFGGESVSQLSAVAKRIVVVTPLAMAQQFARELSIHGWALQGVLPMGHVTSNKDVKRWSSRFGTLDPLLVFASDVDTATALVEENPGRYDLVIVDATGRNAGKHASLRRLKRFDVPTFIVTSERAAEEIDTMESAVWEWTSEDFRALVWPEHNGENGSGALSHYERRLHSRSYVRPIVERISLPVATHAFETHRRIQRLAKQRGEDRLAELDDLLSLSFRIVSHLLRSATPLDEQLPSFELLKKQFAKFDELRRRSNYLSGEEKAAMEDFQNQVGAFLDSLQTENPKASRMRDLLRKQSAAIICPDARLLADLEHHYTDQASHILASNQADWEFANGVIIPGWFRKSRMASLLSPPISNPLTVLLYDVETLWYVGFASQREKARQQRGCNRSRATFFPQFAGWKPPDITLPIEAEPEEDLKEVEEVQDYVFDVYKSRIYQTNRPTDADDTVSARLVLFVGGPYGMFTDTYKLNVVTHLIEGAIDEDDDKASVSQTPANQLEVGDAVVFRQSSRDIIREVADMILPPGTRERSATWRRAILRFVQQNNLSAAQLCERLRDAGCRVQQQAIEVWLRYDDIIAPQAYRSDVTAIAVATDDAELNQNLNAVLDAIAKVRSAHLKASGILAKQVRKLATEVVRQEEADAGSVHLHNGFVIVRVAEVAREKTEVRFGAANRLIEGDSWLE